jgi:hypothetical protein
VELQSHLSSSRSHIFFSLYFSQFYIHYGEGHVEANQGGREEDTQAQAVSSLLGFSHGGAATSY